MKRKFTPAIDLLLPSAMIIRQNILTYFVLMIVPSLLLTYASRSIQSLDSMISPEFFAGVVLTIAFSAPLVYTQTKSSKGTDVPLSEALTKGYHFFWRIILLNIVFSLVVMGGLLLFIIPGFIMLRRYFLSFYYLIDKDCSIKEAMRLSAVSTKKNSSAVYGIVGILFLFYLLGVLGPIGAIAAAILQILYSVAPALRYQEFRSKSFKAAGI